jgi:hypothetical protein
VDRGDGTSGTDVGQYTSLAVGGDGRVLVSYYDATVGRLRYATCGASCLQTVNWSRQVVDGGCFVSGQVCINVGQSTSLAFAGGKARVSYFDVTNGNLKYTELGP